MTREELNRLPEPQRAAFFDLQEETGCPLDLLLKKSLAPNVLDPAILVRNIKGCRLVGIERDGYIHT